MASIWWEEPIAVPADTAWFALRQPGRAHELFAPVLTACTLDGDVRTVTFADGMTVRERIVALDEPRRRLAYTVLGDMFEHHAASMQLVPVDARNCRFVWITDVLPHESTAMVAPLVEAGARALKANLENPASGLAAPQSAARQEA